MQTLNIGIVGTGYMAGVHVAALSRLEGVRVAAVTGHSLRKAQEFCGTRATGARPYHSFTAMLDAEALDALYFCIPPFQHSGEVERAAERGLHLFLEKPIALNAGAARRMVAVIEAAGVVSQVGFMMRFRKSVQALKARIDAGTAGRPALFSGRFWVNMEGADWWRDRSRSGGQVYEQVVHLYDLARYLFGEVEEARGVVANLLHGARADYSIEDTSVGLLRFRNGAMASITGSNCAVPMHFFSDFRVAMEKVTLEYRCTGQTWVEQDVGILYEADGGREEIVEDGDACLEEDRHFVECVRARRQTLCPARDGLRAIEIIEEMNL